MKYVSDSIMAFILTGEPMLASIFSRLIRAWGKAEAPLAQPANFIAVQGKQFISPNGQPLFLKGINLANWLVPEGYMFKFENATSPRLISAVINQLIGEEDAKKFWRSHWDHYITQKDIQFIKRLGFNSVRVPFSYRLFVTDSNPPQLSGVGYELLDRLIGWCRNEAVYVVLDMHVAPGGQTGDNIDDSWGYPFLYNSAANQELTIRLWQDLAQRYQNESIVLGYDLLNEPIAHFFDTNLLNPKLEPLYKRIVAAIRQVDRNHILFLGGAQWNSNFWVFGPPFDSKLAYTFHKYWTAPTADVIQEYVDFSNRHNVPLWLGESGENTDEWIATFRSTLENSGTSWCFWPYKKMDATSCVVSIPRTAEWDAIITFANHPRTTFEEVRNNRPPQATIRKALSNYLENIKLKNCRTNEGFLAALGLGTSQVA
jgi:endoglucanase